MFYAPSELVTCHDRCVVAEAAGEEPDEGYVGLLKAIPCH